MAILSSTFQALVYFTWYKWPIPLITCSGQTNFSPNVPGVFYQALLVTLDLTGGNPHTAVCAWEARDAVDSAEMDCAGEPQAEDGDDLCGR